MAITIEDLEIKIKAKNEARKPLAESGKDLQKFDENVKNTSKTSVKQFAMIGAAIVLVKKAITSLKDAINTAMDMVETDNLFGEVFKDDVKKMGEWVSDVSKKLALDPTAIKNNVALMTALANSMGMVKNNSQTLGKNITLLANDLSSFYNISVEDAFAKLRSGISGQTMPLKELGINVSEAQTKITAMKYGIADTGREMNMQQKAAARYMAIMDQTKDAQGDMARTLDSPANMLRALTTAFKGLAAAIGSVFIPILQATLPYIIAFVHVLTDVFNAIARIAGFDGFKYEGGAKGLDDIGKSATKAKTGLEGATEKAKKFKKELAGFDEVNILRQATDDPNKNKPKPNTGPSENMDFNLPGYDAGLERSKNNMSKIADEIKKILDSLMAKFREINFKPLQDALANLGSAAKPIIDTLAGAFMYLLEKALWPLAKWTISDLLPAFLNVLAGTLRVLEPIIVAFVSIGKVLLDVVLIPLAKLGSFLVVGALNILAATLNIVGGVMKKMQPLVTALTTVLVVFFATWKIIELTRFITASGGVIKVLGQMSGATKLLTAIKNSELVTSISLGKYYVAEKLSIVASTVAKYASNAATALATKARTLESVATFTATSTTIKGTVATKAYSAASIVAATASKALAGAATFLSGPFGWIAIAVTAVVAGLAAYFISANNSKDATDKLKDSQAELQAGIEESKNKFANYDSEIRKHSNETIPEIQRSFADLDKSIREVDLNIDSSGIENISTKVKESSDKSVEAINKQTDLMYQSLSTYYDKSTALTSKQEGNILSEVIQMGEEKVQKVESHEKAIQAILQKAQDEKRELRPQEKEELIRHQKEMSDIAIQALTADEAAIIGQYERLKNKKGELNEAEKKELEKVTDERNEMLQKKDDALYGNAVHSAEQLAKWKVEYSKEHGTDLETVEKINKDRINAIHTDHYNSSIELATKKGDELSKIEGGQSMKSFATFKKIQDERAKTMKEGRDLSGKYNAAEANARMKALDKLEKDLGLSKEQMRNYNKFLDKDANGGVKNAFDKMVKNMDLNPAIDKLNNQKGKMKNVGADSAGGFSQGFKDTWNDFTTSIGGLASDVINGFKKAFDIHSPSRIFRFMGKMIPDGATLGIKDTAHKTVRAITNMAKDMLGVTSQFALAGAGMAESLNSGWLDSIEPMIAEVGISEVANNGLNLPDYQDRSTTLKVKAPDSSQFEELQKLQQEWIVGEGKQEIEIENVIKLNIDGDEILTKVEEANKRKRFRKGDDF